MLDTYLNRYNFRNEWYTASWLSQCPVSCSTFQKTCSDFWLLSAFWANPVSAVRSQFSEWNWVKQCSLLRYAITFLYKDQGSLSIISQKPAFSLKYIRYQLNRYNTFNFQFAFNAFYLTTFVYDKSVLSKTNSSRQLSLSFRHRLEESSHMIRERASTISYRATTPTMPSLPAPRTPTPTSNGLISPGPIARYHSACQLAGQSSLDAQQPDINWLWIIYIIFIPY